MDQSTPAKPPVLVVNDNVEEAEGLCQRLDAWGAHAWLALGAVSAAQLLKTVRPAIVLVCEMRLGGDEPGSVLGWLRRQHEDAARPFFVCAGAGIDERQPAGVDDFDLYLSLPVADEMGRDLVRLAVRKQQQMQQLRAEAAGAVPRPSAADGQRPGPRAGH